MVEDRGTPPASEDGASGYHFERFRAPRGYMDYVLAGPATRLAAVVDPELEMAEPVIVFEHGLRPAYVTGAHTDHVSGARNLKVKAVIRLVAREKAPSSVVDIRVEDGDRLHLETLPLKFLRTPGHAKDLVGILLPGRVLAADALLTVSCGRTDLLNGSAVRQYIPSTTPTEASPTTSSSGPATTNKGHSHATLGDEKQNNPKMPFDSEEEFVEFGDLENPERLDPAEHLAEALKANMI